MKAPPPRRSVCPLSRCNLSDFLPAFVLVALLLPLVACSQGFSTERKSARSISGQFIVFGAPQFSALASSPKVMADTNLVRLEPALLAVSAERIKDALGRQLEIKPGTPWRSQIFLAIHPARSLNESVNVVSQRLATGWDYRVELPDVLPRDRYLRALTGVLLLELANRNAREHSAEVPAWLVEGLTQSLLASGSTEFILSRPEKIVNGLPVTRINVTQRGVDSLAAAHRVLQNHAPLTFEQLSWPTGPQLEGNDDGVYHASAQIFVNSLLDLKNGEAQMRALLESLPNFYNWQLAFQTAFHAEFSSPLDVEKWWAVEVASFIVRDPGPRWTPAVSRARLDALLSVPVEARADSNSLPAHAEISLQTLIRSVDYDRQATILRTRLRDLGLAQYRLTPQFAALAGEYRRVIAAYLGESPGTVKSSGRQGRSARSLQKTGTAQTLERLDELDARRRQIESVVQPDNSVQPGRLQLKF